MNTNGAVNYTWAVDAFGAAASLTLRADLGGGEVAVNITGVNAAPMGTGLPSSAQGVEDTGQSPNLAILVLADADPGDILTLTALGGSPLTTAPGETAAGSGMGSLSLTGTVAALTDAHAVVLGPAADLEGGAAAFANAEVGGSGTAGLTLMGTGAAIDAWLNDPAAGTMPKRPMTRGSPAWPCRPMMEWALSPWARWR